MTSAELRKTAVDQLYRIFIKDAYLNIVLSNLLSSHRFKTDEKSYLISVLNGVVTWRKKYEWIVGGFSSQSPGKIEHRILYYLLIGTHDLVSDSGTPDYSAVNETVEAVKLEKGKKAAGFVNGILRSIQRNASQVIYPDKKADPLKNLSVWYSHPEWMIKRWLNRYGFTDTEKLCNWNNRVKVETTIRINSLKPDTNKFIDYCSSHSFIAKKWRKFPHFYEIRNISSLLKSSWFKQGFFIVQALTSGFPPMVLNPGKDSNVIDLCAAPGGKTTQIGEMMENTGRIVAVDVHWNRLKLIRANIQRLNVENVALVCGNGTDIHLRSADHVLLDVPCSGLGTLCQKPDIRWKRTEKQIKELTELQFRLLENAARIVKKGGTIVYSSCTIEPEENEQVIAGFLHTHPHFVTELLPEIPYIKESDTGFQITILPFQHNLDGSFIAKLRRIN